MIVEDANAPKPADEVECPESCDNGWLRDAQQPCPVCDAGREVHDAALQAIMLTARLVRWEEC